MKIDRAVDRAFDYFIKNGCHPMSASQIATIGGYHKLSISRIEAKALQKIRDNLNIKNIE